MEVDKLRAIRHQTNVVTDVLEKHSDDSQYTSTLSFSRVLLLIFSREYMRLLMICAENLWNAVLKLRHMGNNRSDISERISLQNGLLVLTDTDGDHIVNQRLQDLSFCVVVQTLLLFPL